MSSTPIVIDDFYKVVTRCQCFDQAGENILYLRVLTNLGGVDQEHFGDALSTFLAGFYLPCLNQQASYLGLTLQHRTAAPNPLPYKTSVGTAVGTGGVDPMPRQVSLVITKLTGFTGRTNRGRMYVPFPSLTDQFTPLDHPTAAYIGHCVDLAEATTGAENIPVGIGPVVGVSWQLLHKGVFEQVTDFRVNPLWGTQRRRGDYGRPNPVGP